MLSYNYMTNLDFRRATKIDLQSIEISDQLAKKKKKKYT